MRGILAILLILAQLVWWDIADKVRITASWNWARRVIDREINGRAIRLFAIAGLVTGLRLRAEVSPEKIPDRFIVVSNHQSIIDIAAIMAAFREHSVRFVAKRELRRWFPAVSRVLRVQRHALISRRGDFQTAMREIERLGRSLRSGQGAVIFPEGTRSRDGEVHTFHSGALRRLLRSRPLPIVVLALEGGSGLTRLSDLQRMAAGHQFRVVLVDVLPPVIEKQQLLQQLDYAEQAIRGRIAQMRSKDVHAV